MRLSLIGAMTAEAIGAPGASAGSAGADSRLGPPPSHSQAAGPAPAAVAPRHRPAPVEHYVDLNSAGRKELMTLPGIGDAEAGRIIASRPYLTKTELVTKDVLPVGPFMSIRHLVVAMPKTIAKGTN